MLVVGFESAYFYAKHDQRASTLLDRHMFGKSVLVLALAEGGATNQDIYAGYHTNLQHFVQTSAQHLRDDADPILASRHYCRWLRTMRGYESNAYWYDFDHTKKQATGRQLSFEMTEAMRREFALQVYATYPLTLLRVIAQHYAFFFCVASGGAVIDNDFLREENPQLRPVEKVNSRVLQLVHWAFLALGVAFLISKVWYVYHWGRLAWAGKPKHLPAETFFTLKLGGACMLTVFGYHLFIAMFGVPGSRFLLLSFPLIILAILLMLVVVARDWQTRSPE